MKSASPAEIAAALHDDVCQRLAGLTYRAAILKNKLAARDSAETADAEAIYAQLRDASASLRRLVQDLSGDPRA